MPSTVDRMCHGGDVDGCGGATVGEDPTSGGSCWYRLSPNDLGMRSDTLVSPRVSPVMSHRRVPSLVVTSSLDKSGKTKDSDVKYVRFVVNIIRYTHVVQSDKLNRQVNVNDHI